MAPLVMTCLLDARQVPLLPDFTRQIQRIKSAAGGGVVLFLLSFPVQHTKIWSQVLAKTFACDGETYFCGDGTDVPTGQAVMFFGKAKANAMLSHFQFMESPPGHGHVAFGLTMTYVELRFTNAKKVTEKTVGILWVPDLFCVDKPYFNDANWNGAMGFIQETMVWQRYEQLCGDEGIGIPTLNESSRLLAQERLRAHLGGIIVLSDVRSNFLGDQYAVHSMKMSGVAHAVLGTIANGVFQDTYADQKIVCMPACYKVRPLCYEVMNHSFDFWAQSWASKSASAARETDQQSNSVEVPAGFTLQPSSIYVGLCTSMAEDDAPSDCVVCLERPPTFVFKKCGHLGVCGKCRKWMCKEQFNKSKAKQSQVSPAHLKMDRKLQALSLKCPYCRQITQVLHCSQYTGVVYTV